ncbi:MAG: nucleotidyl transferase AbiEii/AbiGii toxin family protein [Spirochaetaceae bacterium]|nr:nucleotidyl transferase AbiEii/AbiGii toxin family protein [Spirochaetaceae bacterium]
MMNYPDAVSPELLRILRTFMRETAFKDFVLGGGTSLALCFGYRRSIDIDLFTTRPFNSLQFVNQLHGIFENLEIVNRTTGSICAVMQNCKIDIFQHS